MRDILPISLLLVFSSCTFDSDNNSTVFDGGGAIDGQVVVDGGVVDGAIVDAGLVDAEVVQPDANTPDAGNPILLSQNLVVRYFLDDQPNNAPKATDSSDSNPSFNLTVVRSALGGDDFVDVATNRGLNFAAITNPDLSQASAPIVDASRIRTMLHGSTTATIELVVDLTETSEDGRLLHIGADTTRGSFALQCDDTDNRRIHFVLNNGAKRVWGPSGILVNAGRTVLHMVFDSTQAAADDRAVLYVNGVKRNPVAVASQVLAENASINIAPESTFYLGNREQGALKFGPRSVAGTFFYAAMYSGAFTAQQVTNNYGLLQANDDSQPVGPE